MPKKTDIYLVYDMSCFTYQVYDIYIYCNMTSIARFILVIFQVYMYNGCYHWQAADAAGAGPWHGPIPPDPPAITSPDLIGISSFTLLTAPWRWHSGCLWIEPTRIKPCAYAHFKFALLLKNAGIPRASQAEQTYLVTVVTRMRPPGRRETLH